MAALNLVSKYPNSVPITPSDNENTEFQAIIRSGTEAQVFRALLREFLTDSSVQGFKYFCERKRHLSERIFWIIVFVMATYCSGVLIKQTWNQWQETPVIVSFSEKATPVWAIPFPAVTICPETKAIKEIFDFTDIYLRLSDGNPANISQETLKQMDAVFQTCDQNYVRNFEDESVFENFTGSTILSALQSVAVTVNSSISYCSWLYGSELCTKDFAQVITEEGICFTFNALNSRDLYTDEVADDLITVEGNDNVTHWNMDDGYNDKDKNILDLADIYPYRVVDSGIGSGLDIMLTSDVIDFDYLCRGPIQGFKLALHNPVEMPHVSKHFIRVPIKQEVIVSVKPHIITTSQNLRDYSPQRKQCFSAPERKLRFFKVYTQRNCELECNSNFTKNECGCVKFSSPRDKSTPICGIGKLPCYLKARDTLVRKTFNESVFGGAKSDLGGCNCLPACTTITYEAEVSQSKYDIAKLYRSTGGDTDGIQASSLFVSFKEQQFQTSKRSELQGVTDFIAKCGGILSLFIGITALSFIEIFYYCTLRLYWTLRIYRFGKRSKKISVVPANGRIIRYNDAAMTSSISTIQQ